MEGNCKYIESAVTDGQQEVVLQLGYSVGGQQLLTVKTSMSQNVMQDLI
jgi:hypothetical protein